jgi:hypothetical protein
MADPLTCWRCRRVLPEYHEDYAICGESGFSLPCSAAAPGAPITQPEPEAPVDAAPPVDQDG